MKAEKNTTRFFHEYAFANVLKISAISPISLRVIGTNTWTAPSFLRRQKTAQSYNHHCAIKMSRHENASRSFGFSYGNPPVADGFPLTKGRKCWDLHLFRVLGRTSLWTTLMWRQCNEIWSLVVQHLNNITQDPVGQFAWSHWGRMTHICVTELGHHWFR